MKNLILISFFLIIANWCNAQSFVCNPNGNMVIISNYDGGYLNIIADANVPNLIVGIVSYEAVQVTFSGAYVNNIAEVHYAGFNSSNNHCGTTINATTFTGLAGTVPVSINFAPPSPLPDPNGNNSIICAYSCDTTVAMGGCNTVTQVEAYFMQQFPGSSIYSHTIQYGCWQLPLSISAGGNCCLSPPPAITITTTIDSVSCYGVCDASINVFPQGTAPPFTYLWSSGTPIPPVGLCAGTYTVTVTDANGITATEQIIITEPDQLALAFSVVPDAGGCSGQLFALPAGGTTPYTYSWDSCGTSSGSTAPSLSNVCAGICCLTLYDFHGCAEISCVQVPSTVGLNNLVTQKFALYPNPSPDGKFVVSFNIPEITSKTIRVTDQLGRFIPFSLIEFEDQLILDIGGRAGIFFVQLEHQQFLKLVVLK